MILDYARIRETEVREDPFPFFTLTDALAPAEARNVAMAFPAIDRPGAIPANDTTHGSAFARLLDELRGNEFRTLVAQKFQVDLEGKEIIVNVRGQTRWTDGNIHTDTPSKLVTVLLYFNDPGEAVQSTGLRILRNGTDIDDFVEEVPPLLGTMVAFKVTPDCWHGFKPFVGKRLSLQLNYLAEVRMKQKHERHRRMLRHAGRRANAVVNVVAARVRESERAAGLLWQAMLDRRTPWYAKAVAAVSSIFAISPIDLSPDVVPVIGHVDDLAILALGTFVTAKLVPEKLMTEFREREAAVSLAHRHRAAAAVLCVWIVATGLALARMFPSA